MEQNTSRTFIFLICIIKLVSVIIVAQGLELDKKSWSYELKSIISTSSDPEKLDIDLNIERVSRGVYAISGTIFINFDIVEKDLNNVAAKSFRSAQGDDNYKVLPFQMPNKHIFKVINTYYKDILMDTMKDCSDLPFFVDSFQPPLQKRAYKLESCQVSQDGFPNYLQDGFYKVLISGSGEVDWNVEIIAEVTPNL